MSYLLDKYHILFKPSADIPAYAVMESTNSETVGGEICVDTRKYVAGAPKKVILVNGPLAVSSGKYGRCALAADRPLAILYDTSISAGQICGPTNGATGLSPAYPGFTCIGPGPVSGTVVAQRETQPTLCRGLLAAALTTTTASVSVDNVVALSGLVPVANTSATLTVYNIYATKGFAGPDNGVCYFHYAPKDDRWEFLDVECT